MKSTAVATGAEALAALDAQNFDCLVLDLGLSDMSGFELLEKMKEDPRLAQIPVIVYTGKELSKKQETELRRFAETIIIKDVKSPDRLLDETALFLHRVESSLPAEKRKMLEQLHQHDPVAGRQQGADRRRRHPQHLRADQRARAARHGGGLRGERQGRHRRCCRRRRTSTWC